MSVAGAREASRPFFFVVMADPQIPKILGSWYSEKLFPLAVSHTNRLQPEMAIILGDMIQANAGAFDKALTTDHAKRYFAIADSLTMPVKLMGGNHDVLNFPTKEAYAFYRKTFGDTWYSFVSMNNLFIVLESNLIKHPDSMPDTLTEQMNWLRLTLQNTAATKYDNTIVLLHHSLCHDKIDEPEDYYNLPVSRRVELLQLFHQYGIAAVFSGHYHRNAYVKDGELELITISSVGVQEAGDKPGFSVVKFDSNSIAHHYYTYEEMPGLIESDSPGLTITAPNGGEQWLAGSEQTVTWSSRSMASAVMIEYRTENGWRFIIKKTANDGAYTWLIPDSAAAPEGTKIRITTITSGVSDESDTQFFIEKNSAVHDEVIPGKTVYTLKDVAGLIAAANNGSVRIVTPKGSTLFSGTAAATACFGESPGRLPNGVYIIIIETEKGLRTARFISFPSGS
jgi:hypothetical protein